MIDQVTIGVWLRGLSSEMGNMRPSIFGYDQYNK
jgi:hypothetical protein